ncbi:hypothetical protein NYP20_17055 [Pseudomonas sp. N3-W]|nr:hypothetical protein [Pseudomonas sp. N3-W]UWF47055.1 hypothetical protein NYP20_17055 [Pseudomonas sp. N3-W]
MTTSPLQLDSNYIVNTLIQNLNSVAFATEDGSNASAISSFSYAANGNSTYSFGLYQYDIGGLPQAQTFLSSIGFSSSQISQLSQAGGLTDAQLSALSTQLGTALQDPTNGAALQTLNDAWANGLVTQLQNSLNTVYASNPSVAEQIYQSPEMQLQILDYANQFHLSTAGAMTSWLSGQSVTESGGSFQLAAGSQLTSDDIQNFVMGSKYAVNYTAAETTREVALDSTLSSISLGTSITDINAAFNGSLNSTNIVIGSGVQAVVAGSNDVFSMGDGSGVDAAGSANSFTCGTNTVVSVNGTESASCSSGNLALAGDGITGSLSLNSTVSVSGSNNNFSLGNGSNINIASVGSNSVTCGQESVVMTGNSSTACNNGNLEISDSSANAAIGVSGSGAAVTANAADITLDSNASATVSGSNNNVDAGAGSQATISGSGNDITGDTNASVNLTSGSSWDVVTMMKNGEVILASADDDITIHASNSYVSMGVEDRFAIDGSTTNVTGGIDNTVTTQGSGENVTLGTGSTLAMTGTNDEANLSNGTVWLGANTTPGASPVGDCAGRRQAGNRSADSQPRYRLCSSGAGRRNQAGCLSVYPLRHHRRQGHVDFAGRGQGRQVGVGLSGTDTTGRTFDCGGWQKYSAGTGDVEFGGDQDRAAADY